MVIVTCIIAQDIGGSNASIADIAVIEVLLEGRRARWLRTSHCTLRYTTTMHAHLRIISHSGWYLDPMQWMDCSSSGTTIRIDMSVVGIIVVSAAAIGSIAPLTAITVIHLIGIECKP